MKYSLFVVLLFPATLFARTIEVNEDQAAALASCKGKTISNFCYNSTDCENARILKRQAIDIFKDGAAMKINPLEPILDSYERRHIARHGVAPRASDYPAARPSQVIYYAESERLCAELVAKAVSMVSEEYQIPAAGGTTVTARRANKIYTAAPGTIEFWWSHLK